MISLTKREKILVKVLLIFISVLVIYYVIALPVIRLVGTSDNDDKKYTDDLEKLESIYKQYREVQQKKSIYTSLLNRKNENTTSLIEQLANSLNISRHIAYTRSNQSNIQNKFVRVTTEVRVEGIAMQHFLKFLYEIENSDNLIKVNYLRITPALKGTNTYDAQLKIDNFISK
jgi:hypothetical protein